MYVVDIVQEMMIGLVGVFLDTWTGIYV